MLGIPPHLLPVAAVLLIALFIGLVWFFRRSPTARAFTEEALGDDTPEAAIRDYRFARERLLRHRGKPGLDPVTARRIDEALYHKA
jgi:hypothetical protein